LSFFKKLIKGKKEEGKVVTAEVKKTKLEEICGDDKEVYEALKDTMFLDPRKLLTSIKEAAENAKKFEKAKDLIRARTNYEIAGGLAIWEGNVKKVIEFFNEVQKLSGKNYPILKIPEKAVAKAQEYYKKYLI